MREGLSDAIVTMGTTEYLCAHLNSEDEEVDPIIKNVHVIISL